MHHRLLFCVMGLLTTLTVVVGIDAPTWATAFIVGALIGIAITIDNFV